MFNDGYSPHKDMEKNPLDTADDTSCFVVYPGVIFWGCGQVVVLLLSLVTWRSARCSQRQGICPERHAPRG